MMMRRISDAKPAVNSTQPSMTILSYSIAINSVILIIMIHSKPNRYLKNGDSNMLSHIRIAIGLIGYFSDV